MKLFYKLLRQNPDTREGVITVASALGIFVNLLIASLKITIGVLCSSLAILSEGANNASDAATAILTIAGAKLSARRPTQKHPFGFGRIEYLTSLVISTLILTTGFELLVSSVGRIFDPVPLEISPGVLAVIASSALVKLALSRYTIQTGKRVDSSSLVAVGTECQNDFIISSVTIISSLVFLLFHVSIDAYAGIFTSLVVLKAGLDVLCGTISELLGKAGNRDLADRLYREITSVELIENAADMMLHSYGPDNYSGSVSIEVNRHRTVEETHAALYALRLRLMREYHVNMAFDIRAVEDTDSERTRQLRAFIDGFVHSHEHIIGYHALYIDQAERCIYVDLVVDYGLKDREKLKNIFSASMKEVIPAYDLALTIETEYV